MSAPSQLQARMFRQVAFLFSTNKQQLWTKYNNFLDSFFVLSLNEWVDQASKLVWCTAIASFWSGCTVQIRISSKALFYCIWLLFMVCKQHAWFLDGSILCALCWLLMRGIGSNLNKVYYNAQSPVNQDFTPFHCSHQMNLASIPSHSQLFIQNLTKLHFKATKRVK